MGATRRWHRLTSNRKVCWHGPRRGWSKRTAVDSARTTGSPSVPRAASRCPAVPPRPPPRSSPPRAWPKPPASSPRPVPPGPRPAPRPRRRPASCRPPCRHHLPGWSRSPRHMAALILLLLSPALLLLLPAIRSAFRRPHAPRSRCRRRLIRSLRVPAPPHLRAGPMRVSPAGTGRRPPGRGGCGRLPNRPPENRLSRAGPPRRPDRGPLPAVRGRPRVPGRPG
jgi:hypothetical protein